VLRPGSIPIARPVLLLGAGALRQQ